MVFNAVRIGFAVCCASCALSASAQTYRVIDLGTLNGGVSQGSAVNNSGQVAGYSYPTTTYIAHGFLSSPNGGVLHDLGTLGGTTNYAYGLNDRGQVAGFSTTYGGAQHAFLSDADGGALKDLGTLGSGSVSQATGVNNAGRVTGVAATDATGTIVHAFLSGADGGALADLGTLGGSISTGSAVNDVGQVVGFSYTSGNAAIHAFLTGTNGGALSDLGTLGGAFSFGLGLNAIGQVAGYSTTPSGATHAFLSGANGSSLVDLGTLGGTDSRVQSVNDSGIAVGYSTLAGSATKHAIVYDAVSGLRDLNTLLDVSGAGWSLNYAYSVSNSGFITGYGTIGGQQHAFLLTANPVPEPSILVALGVGVVALRRRRQISR